MNNIYDFIVIGAGISACTFASALNNRFPDNSILLIEHGRRIGGRSTTRNSRKNISLEFDHGLPAISLSKDMSKDLYTLISPIIQKKILIDITKDILIINEFGQIVEASLSQKIYRCLPFMINFCDELIKVSTKPNNINFLFQTLAVSIIRKNSLWEVKTNHQRLLKSKNVILSSSLIAHPRCIDIMKINSIPLYDAFKNVKDDIVDSILRKTIKQEYLKRKNYIFHVSNLKIVNNFDQKYLHMQFSECLHDDFSFERIIFQMQRDGSMIIILHCSYISTFVDIQLEQIFQILRRIFIKEKKYLNLFDHAILLDTMDWRASQPINNLLSKELQWSSISNIGFCGDWFDFGNFSRVESAMNSSIRLAKILI